MDEQNADNSSTKSNDEQSWVLDSLIGFLKSPLWSSSLHNFIDQMSIVFEPDDIEDNEGNVEDRPEYQNIFKDYRALVDQLITSHMSELGISERQFASACDLAEGMLAAKLKQMLFEELWAAENFEVFVRLMARRNVELQLEALDILAQRYGLVYDVFVPVGTSPKHFLSEEHVMREAILRSLNDLELDSENQQPSQQKQQSLYGIKYSKKQTDDTVGKEVGQIDSGPNDDDKDDDTTLDENTVQQDKARLEAVKHKANRKMREALRSAISSDRGDHFVETFAEKVEEDNQQQQQHEVVETNQTTDDEPPNFEQQIDGTGVDNSNSSKPVPPSVNEDDDDVIPKASPKMNVDEIKRRADYLRQQRDKIIELRQKERSEHISKYLTKQKVKGERPKTARRGGGGDSGGSSGSASTSAATTGENVDKTEQGKNQDLAYRKTLAARLKAEVIDRN